MSERPTGATVIPIDPSAHPESRNSRYALGVNPHTGETYLIHTEGVSYYVSHDHPYRFNDYDFMSKFWTLYDVIANMPLQFDEACDLADWVRKFGDRLESNHRITYDLLTREEPYKDGTDDKFDSQVAKQIISAAIPDRPEEHRQFLRDTFGVQ